MFYISSGFIDNRPKYYNTALSTHQDFKLKVNIANDQVSIQWNSKTEMCGDYFLVEKSNNARDWYEITSAIAYGNNNELYTEIDETYDGTMCFYRVVQVHLDKTLFYSEIIEVPNFKDN